MKKMRFSAIILAALICFGTLGTLGASAESNYVATRDVNGDGEVDTKDLTRLMKYVSGADVTVSSSDINLDGVVNTKDISRLMKFIAGPDSKFKNTYNELVSWTKENGTYEVYDEQTGAGFYMYKVDRYTSDGEVFTVGIGYSPDEDSIMIAYAGINGVDKGYRSDLLDSITILVNRESETNDRASYVVLYDNETLMDLSAYVMGSFYMSDIGIDSYIDANFGVWDEAGMLSYTEALIRHTLLEVNRLLPNGLYLWDLGFTVNQ